MITSCRFLNLFISHFRGISHGLSSTNTHARLNTPDENLNGTRKREAANQRMPITCPCPARAASIQRSTNTALRRLWRMESQYQTAQKIRSEERRVGKESRYRE